MTTPTLALAHALAAAPTEAGADRWIHPPGTPYARRYDAATMARHGAVAAELRKLALEMLDRSARTQRTHSELATARHFAWEALRELYNTTHTEHPDFRRLPPRSELYP